ncbi:MAG: hypothetical protein WC679_12780 [Bacteroidales bacterium]|jgi:hypothetical protein
MSDYYYLINETNKIKYTHDFINKISFLDCAGITKTFCEIMLNNPGDKFSIISDESAYYDVIDDYTEEDITNLVRSNL